MALLWKVGAKIPETIEPKDGSKYTLEELQEYVGGYIECIPFFNDLLLIVNENGKLDNFEENVYATMVVQAFNAIQPTDYISGNAVIINNDELD